MAAMGSDVLTIIFRYLCSCNPTDTLPQHKNLLRIYLNKQKHFPFRYKMVLNVVQSV